jgi:hypothetical protein
MTLEEEEMQNGSGKKIKCRMLRKDKCSLSDGTE